MFFGSQVAASDALLSWLAGPSAAMRFRGSFARCSRCAESAAGRPSARRPPAPPHGRSGPPCCSRPAAEVTAVRCRAPGRFRRPPGSWSPSVNSRRPGRGAGCRCGCRSRCGRRPARPGRRPALVVVSAARPLTASLSSAPRPRPAAPGARGDGFIQAAANTGASLGPATGGSAAANCPAVKNQPSPATTARASGGQQGPGLAGAPACAPEGGPADGHAGSGASRVLAPPESLGPPRHQGRYPQCGGRVRGSVLFASPARGLRWRWPGALRVAGPGPRDVPAASRRGHLREAGWLPYGSTRDVKGVFKGGFVSCEFCSMAPLWSPFPADSRESAGKGGTESREVAVRP